MYIHIHIHKHVYIAQYLQQNLLLKARKDSKTAYSTDVESVHLPAPMHEEQHEKGAGGARASHF